MAPTFTLSASTGRWILLSTILASSMVFIDGSALGVALPSLQDDLGASGVELLWIINGYLLLLASLLLIGGSLGDHIGRKRVFRAGIILFTLSSLACGLAPTTTILIGARFVQGIGGALMVPGSLAIISALFVQEDRGKAIGIWSAASTITTMGGPILGGFLANAGLWRVVFFINLPLAMITLYGLTHVPENRDESAPSQLDIPGALLTVLGLSSFSYGLITLGDRGIKEGLSDPLIIVSLIAGIVLLIVFLLVEYRSDHPMVNLALFKVRTFSGTNAMTFFLYGALTGALFFLPLTLIQAQGYSAAAAGFVFIPFDILLTALSPWAGGMVDRYGPRLLLTIGPAVVGAGFLALSFPGLGDGPGSYWTTYLPGIIGIGLGMGITVAPLTTAVMGSVSSQHSGIASGINNAMSRMAGVVAIATFGAVALVLFSSTLDTKVDRIEGLTPETRQAVMDQADKLGDAKAPEGLPDGQTRAINRAVNSAFVDTFRVLCYIAAAMAWISALLAFILVEPRLVPQVVEALETGD
jgi:EmrB/QacA subfamily drug resistance transporter